MTIDTKKISELNAISRVPEKGKVAVAVSDNLKETFQSTLTDLRSSLLFENAFSTIQEGIAGTGKGEAFFVYTDESKQYVAGYQNVNGSTATLLYGKDGNPVTYGTYALLKGGGAASVSPYLTWVYNDGAAIGGETELVLDQEVLDVPELYVNGSRQLKNYTYSFDRLTGKITLGAPLKTKDIVVAYLRPLPGENTNVPDISHYVTFAWLYRDGAALGGETTITPPYSFKTVPAVYLNGTRQVLNKNYEISSDGYKINFPKPLVKDDLVQVILGGESTEIVPEVVGTAAEVYDRLGREEGYKLVGNLLPRNDVRRYSTQTLGDSPTIDDLVMALAVAVNTEVYISPQTTLTLTKLPSTLTKLYGGGTIKLNASGTTFTLPDGFILDDIRIQSLTRIGCNITVKNGIFNKLIMEDISGDTTLSRFNPISFEGCQNLVVTNLRTFGCGFRQRNGGSLRLSNFYIDVNFAGEGTDGNANGTDGIKLSIDVEAIIENGEVRNSSRDVIDGYMGSKRLVINNVKGYKAYFNGIELKRKAEDTDPAQQVADVIISNVEFIDCGRGNNAAVFGGIYILDETGSSAGSTLVVSKVLISNAVIKNYGLGSGIGATNVGVYLSGIQSAYLSNVIVNDVKVAGGSNGYGLQAIRCVDLKVANSSFHGETRGMTVDTCDIQLSTVNAGFQPITGALSTLGIVFAGTNVVNGTVLTVKGSSRSLSAESATLNGSISGLVATNSLRIDLYDYFELINPNITGTSTTTDAIQRSTSAAGTLKIVGGQITNCRYAINQQGLNRLIMQAVTVNTTTLPVGGATGALRIILGCDNRGTGAWPTVTGSDIIANNLVAA